MLDIALVLLIMLPTWVIDLLVLEKNKLITVFNLKSVLKCFTSSVSMMIVER